MSRVVTREQVDDAWWKEAVVYQIYPRSFNDSNGDGIGDIPGIVEKIDYLDDLGVDIVWLCPVYDSPNHDNGYDIRDYHSIMDEFGSMADWETLLEALHARGMRLIMDLVVNHTSKEHEWFQRSRRREGKYADYYHWREGGPDEPPNNWESIFGGPAWTYDEERGQWYLHLFDENQPDLNWRNPDVREDVGAMIEWWLEKGIDGFRLDAIDHLSKTEGLPDGDPDAEITGLQHYSHGPRLHEYLREVYDETLSNYDVMTVGEMGGADIEGVGEYAGEDAAGLDMIFQFSHMGIDTGPDGQWDLDHWGEWELTDLKEVISRKQAEIGWDALFVGNHDQPRIVSRLGDEEYREESATLIATFLLTLRGTPYIYQGEEIGMMNAEFESLEEIDDPMTIGKVEALIDEGRIDTYEEVADLVNYQSRDHARTPVQWSDGANGGFTDGDPWLKTNENYVEINVEAARESSNSIWNHYQTLIDLRHNEDVLVYGEYDLILPEDEHFYAYTRTFDGETVLVILNWSTEAATFDCGAVETSDADLLISNYGESPSDPDGQSFRPFEAAVYHI